MTHSVKFRAALLGIAICLACAAQTVFADDWPVFRGPQRNGISSETAWLSKWTTTPNQLWKASVGEGLTSVTVKAGRLFVVGHAQGKDTVFCFDANTGAEVWKFSYFAPALSATKPDYPGPRATPTANADEVYSISRDGQVFCLIAATGKVKWSQNIVKDLGLRTPAWGFASSPIVLGNMLILNAGLAGLALDKTTGKPLWKSDNGDAGFDTPIVFDQAGKQRLAMFNCEQVVCVDAATGQLLWRHPWKTMFKCNCADLVYSDGKLFVSSAYNFGSALLDITGQSPKVLWQNKEMQNHFPSSVLWNGYLYGCDGDPGNNARLKCVELATGQTKWAEEALKFCSLMMADGKLIILTEKGELVIAQATPDKYTELSRAQALGGPCWVVPVLANGKIYARNNKGDLVCLNVTGGK